MKLMLFWLCIVFNIWCIKAQLYISADFYHYPTIIFVFSNHFSFFGRKIISIWSRHKSLKWHSFYIYLKKDLKQSLWLDVFKAPDLTFIEHLLPELSTYTKIPGFNLPSMSRWYNPYFIDEAHNGLVMPSVTRSFTYRIHVWA